MIGRIELALFPVSVLKISLWMRLLTVSIPDGKGLVNVAVEKAPSMVDAL